DRLVIIAGGRVRAAGTRDELLAGAGTVVRAADEVTLVAALGDAGLDARRTPAGDFVVDADPERVGRAARDGGVVLTRLGEAPGAGLEQLFFELTGGDAAPAAAPSHPTDLAEAIR